MIPLGNLVKRNEMQILLYLEKGEKVEYVHPVLQINQICLFDTNDEYICNQNPNVIFLLVNINVDFTVVVLAYLQFKQIRIFAIPQEMRAFRQLQREIRKIPKCAQLVRFRIDYFRKFISYLRCFRVTGVCQCIFQAYKFGVTHHIDIWRIPVISMTIHIDLKWHSLDMATKKQESFSILL